MACKAIEVVVFIGFDIFYHITPNLYKRSSHPTPDCNGFISTSFIATSRFVVADIAGSDAVLPVVWCKLTPKTQFSHFQFNSMKLSEKQKMDAVMMCKRVEQGGRLGVDHVLLSAHATIQCLCPPNIPVVGCPKKIAKTK